MYEALRERLKKHEGVVPHLYLDTLGLVTCGVGHMIPTAAAMSRVEMVCADGTPATQAMKEWEWAHVKNLQAGHTPPYYEQRTKLRMTPESVDRLLAADLNGFVVGIRLLLNFDAFPEPAQEALLDMAFQLGVGGLATKFPHLTAAVRARNWALCANQCHRAGIAEWRNKATADLFLEAAKCGN